MYGAKRMPNRWRINRYRDYLIKFGLHPKLLEPKNG